MEPVRVTLYDAVSYGYQKRGDLCVAGKDVWEAPDGKLITCQEGQKPMVGVLTDIK